MLAKGHYMPLPTISAINMAKDLNSLQVINSLHSHELTKLTYLVTNWLSQINNNIGKPRATTIDVGNQYG